MPPLGLVEVPAVPQSLWEFRAHCSMGSVLPHALCCTRLQPNQEHVCVGTTEGALLVYTKGIAKPVELIGFETISVVEPTSSCLPPNCVLVLCLEGTVSLVEFDGVRLRTLRKDVIPPNCHTAVERGGTIFAGSMDRKVNVLRWDDSRFLFQHSLGCTGPVFSLAIAKWGGLTLVLTSTPLELALFDVTGSARGEVVWRTAFRTDVQQQLHRGQGTVALPAAVDIRASRNGSLLTLAVATEDGYVAIYESDGAAAETESVDSPTVANLKFSLVHCAELGRMVPRIVLVDVERNRSVIVSSTNDGRVFLLDRSGAQASARVLRAPDVCAIAVNVERPVDLDREPRVLVCFASLCEVGKVALPIGAFVDPLRDANAAQAGKIQPVVRERVQHIVGRTMADHEIRDFVRRAFAAKQRATPIPAPPVYGVF